MGDRAGSVLFFNIDLYMFDKINLLTYLLTYCILIDVCFVMHVMQ